ncbi:MBL fold metallo-hydrolase [Thermobifida halotolerans]|uniref:MBL fold metallo-hydrolase n=1 Tax=Thermobifida halotolerans TaxID=483545 RepID=A0A399G621_9ACTN|nr:MBL fold metallo-hydrolase [Thermobifida halotolerans]UOE18268.1 MBL fold metallo-hydrolase [Thermobifida halotolerans]
MTEDTGAASVTVDGVVTSGPFWDGAAEQEADANVWIVGDDRGAIVVDPAHDATAISRGLGDRELMAIVCTHAHETHINAAEALADLADAPILLHPADERLWSLHYPDRAPDAPLLHGERLQVGGVELEVRHTPGHTPGAVCLYAPALATVFTGDTLLANGPGSTDRPHSDPAAILVSIGDHLLTLPPETTVRPGHGGSTTVAAQAARLTG